MNVTTTMESFQYDGVSSSIKSLITESSETITNTTEDPMSNEQWFKKMEEVVSIVVPIFFSIVVLVGFIGNLLVVLVVTFNKQMRNTTNLLIMNLAVADLLFIVFCVPFSATAYAFPHNWPFGNTVCKIFQLTTYATAFVSIYTLVLMSLDRFLAVVFPIRSMTWRTDCNCIIAITLTWMVTIIFCIPLFFSHSEMKTPSNNSYCDFAENKTIEFLPESWGMRWSILAFKLSFFGTAYVLPMVFMCVLYSIMLHRLWKTGPVGRASAESIRNKKRVVKLVMAVVFLFAICWLPIHVIMVLRALNLYVNTPLAITIQIISHILAYSNSCVNPILYAFLSEPFRRGFWSIITCIRPSGPHGIQHNGYELTEFRNKKEDPNRRMSKDVLSTDKLNDKKRHTEKTTRKDTQETMAPLVSKDEAENSKEPLQPNGSNNETQEREQKHLETEKNGSSGTMPSVTNLNSHTHSSIATSATVVT